MVVDAAERPTQITVPGVTPEAMHYDPSGRLDTLTQGARVWRKGYDPNGYLASEQDPLTHTVSFANDAIGRPQQTVFADGRQLNTAFDADNNLMSLLLPGAQPSGPSHQLTYTPVDLLQSYTPPSLGAGSWATQYQYDLDRRLQQVTRPDGVTMQYAYDPQKGRLTSVTYPQGTQTWSYSPTTGQLLTVASPSGETLAYGYDGFLRKAISWSGPVSGSVALGFVV